MRMQPSSIHMFLGLILSSTSHLVTIRSSQGSSVLKVFGENIGSTSNPEDILTTFRASTKKASGLVRNGRSANRLSISPEGSSLYMTYDKSKGLVLSRKKVYWKYRSAGNNGYMLKLDDKCLTWLSNNNFAMLKCNRGDERQVFLFEEQESSDSTTSEDEVADRTHIEEAVVKEVPEGRAMIHSQSASSSPTSDSGSSSSDEHVTRPIFISLNLKGASPPNAEPPKPISTTTIYKPSEAPTPKVEKHPIKLPSNPPPNRKTSEIFHSESSSEEYDIPKSKTVLYNILCNQDWESSHEGMIGADSLYPELEKLFGQLHSYEGHPEVLNPKGLESSAAHTNSSPKHLYVRQGSTANPPYQASPTARSC